MAAAAFALGGRAREVDEWKSRTCRFAANSDSTRLYLAVSLKTIIACLINNIFCSVDRLPTIIPRQYTHKII